jgi:predicted RNase H-like nuclease (RuvC/YqgF family)
MSQTETVMVFALGFCSALLVILLFGRSLWSAIGHWSGWKGKRSVPNTVLDLQAERDTLRAERAMLTKRVETGATDLKMRMAEQMAEVARNRNRVLDLSASLKASHAETEKMRAANTELQAQVALLKIQIEDNVRAINEAWAKATDNSLETESERKAALELHKNLIEHRLKIKNFETEIQALREIVAMFVPSHAGDESPERLKKLAQKSSGLANGYSEVPFELSSVGKAEDEETPAALPIMAATAVDVSQPANDEQSEGTVGTDPSGDQPPTEIAEESEDMAKGITNVLSLTDKIRSLQKA